MIRKAIMFNEVLADKNDFKVTDNKIGGGSSNIGSGSGGIIDPWQFSAKHPERPCPEFDINQYNKEKREKHSFLFWGGEIADLKPIK